MTNTLTRLSSIEFEPAIELPWLGESSRDVFALLAIEHLEPRVVAPRFLPTAALSDPAIISRLITALKWDEALQDAEFAGCLEGGLIVRGDAQGTLLDPACCSDLSSIVSWKHGAEYRGSEWLALAIGHPWVALKFEAGRITISTPYEGTERARPCWSVKPGELQRAIARAEEELLRFAGVVADALRMRGTPDPDRKAFQIAGLHDLL